MFESGAFWASKLLFEALDCITMDVKINNTFKLISVCQLIHSTRRPNRAMNKETENLSDRELFSELFKNQVQSTYPKKLHRMVAKVKVKVY